MTENTFSKPMRNNSRICRPYGAWDFVLAFSTKMSLLTELAVTGKPAGPSLGKEKSLARVRGRYNRLVEELSLSANARH